MTLHLFTACGRVYEMWEELLAHIYIFLPAIPESGAALPCLCRV